MIYAFLKWLVKIASRIFFSKVEVIDKARIPKGGPLIVVANHPNTFMDPILIAVLLKQQVYFLAKATVFGSPLQNWILSHVFNMIPVYRKQDLPEGQKADNNAIFEKCFKFLAKKGTLLIFPEGTSVMEKKLREIKTGTARIALGAEQQHNFELGLQILPVGLNYRGGQYFRSEVSIEFAKPISVRQFKEQYLENERETVSTLTEEIRLALEKQLVLAKDKNQERMLERAGSIFQKELTDDVDISGHQLQKAMAEALVFFTKHDATFIADLQVKLNAYYRKLNYLKLKDQHLSKQNLASNLWGKFLSVGTFLFLGVPFWLLGVLINYLPYKVPAFVASKVSKHIEYRAPVMLVVGMFVFSIYYTIALVALWHFTQITWLTLGFIPVAVATGFFAMYYWNVSQENLINLKLLYLFKKDKELIKSLIEERKDIYYMLKDASKKYLDA